MWLVTSNHLKRRSSHLNTAAHAAIFLVNVLEAASVLFGGKLLVWWMVFFTLMVGWWCFIVKLFFSISAVISQNSLSTKSITGNEYPGISHWWTSISLLGRHFINSAAIDLSLSWMDEMRRTDNEIQPRWRAKTQTWSESFRDEDVMREIGFDMMWSCSEQRKSKGSVPVCCQRRICW